VNLGVRLQFVQLPSFTTTSRRQLTRLILHLLQRLQLLTFKSPTTPVVTCQLSLKIFAGREGRGCKGEVRRRYTIFIIPTGVKRHFRCMIDTNASKRVMSTTGNRKLDKQGAVIETGGSTPLAPPLPPSSPPFPSPCQLARRRRDNL